MEDVVYVPDDNMSPLTYVSYRSPIVTPVKKKRRMTSTRDKHIYRVELNEAKKMFEER